MPIPLQERVVYGPVSSRRLGQSLGVNILPRDLKVCNMNCAYCQYNWTRERRGIGAKWPTPARVESAVGARMRRAAAANERIDCITVAGHGEPTLHPEFEEIATRLHTIRDRTAPGIRLVILSNSTTADWPDVRRGLLQFDERQMKLDAGDPVTYARINGAGLSVRTIIDSLSTLPSIVVQSLFVADSSHRIDNSTDAAVRDWLTALDRIQPAHVHVYTLDRPPACTGLRRVSATKLTEIAERARAAGHSAEAIV